MKRPIITLLTDFGLADYYVGAMKGVILGICPDAQLVDITHEIPPYQIRQAAWVLQQVWPCFPVGTVHLAVVDPGVGSQRKPILLEAGGQFWVAPDNGVLTEVHASFKNVAVREITATEYFRHPVSHTFHGRDVFAPVAAHLATGRPPTDFGCPTREFMRLEKPLPIKLSETTWRGEVLWVDRFGNIVTNLDYGAFGHLASSPFELRFGATAVTQYAQYYSAMEDSVPYLAKGSTGYLEVALNQGHAALTLGISPGSTFTLSRQKALPA